MDGRARERIQLRTADEIARVREACLVVHDVLDELVQATVPGVTTAELDRLARTRARERGAEPAFLGYHGYPASLCTSVNDEVVHGIPSEGRVLREGDVVGLDFGVVLDGWFGDSARTVPVGRASAEAVRLLAGDARGAGARHRGGASRAAASATSAQRSRRTWSRAASRSSASSSGTASDGACTSRRRSRTSACAAPGRRCAPG